MAEYKIGRGLIEGGTPDPDWNMGPIKLWPRIENVWDEDGMNIVGTRILWRAKMQWGDTWDELIFGNGDTPEQALADGFEKARKDGAPEWFWGIVSE